MYVSVRAYVCVCMHCTFNDSCISYLSECDCNEYDASCNDQSGVCTCYDVGVVGPRCGMCNTNTSYQGNADNFCFCEFTVSYSLHCMCSITDRSVMLLSKAK